MPSSTTLNEPANSDAQSLFAEAKARLDRNDLNGAIESIDKLLAMDGYIPGALFLKSVCYERMTFPAPALQAAKAERILAPDYPGLEDQIKKLSDRMAVPGTSVPSARPWSTSLDQNGIRHFEFCSARYDYRSIPMSKNLFDLALYPTLLWDTKPRTIIEVGSFYGGSAVWMADMTQSWGLDTHVYSVDVNKVRTARHERVTFIEGNGRDLGTVFSSDFLAKMPRPLLVIEDADHSYQTTAAVMSFFNPLLNNGEYMVIEDVMTAPNETGKALHEFLAAHPNDYLVDRNYCDFFGVNVTWCVNGYLRRINSSVPTIQ